MKKRIISILLVLMMVLPMVGCSCQPMGDAETTERAQITTLSPETTMKPETTKAPDTTKAPETTMKLETTKAPETTKTPDTTKAPDTTKTPETTMKPETTRTPETTKAPETTKTPETTMTPDTTKAPETTKEPETTKAPETTKEPEIIQPTENVIAYYDDHLTSVGKVSASASNLKIDGNAVSLVTVGGVKYLRASGIGEATVSDGTNSVRVTVRKAKINIIVIMGQSNSGNHFANATSDIRCAIGTAYWWGNGQGTGATAPVSFTSSTKGFHAPLLAELYAQSVANGAPEKNVLVWHEGGSQNGEGTSKNGSTIYGWAKSATDASGTDYTVTMVNNCVKYYEKHSDKYEIVSKGVYWLQGEGDGVRGIDPTEYIGCFMAMWTKLKTEADLEYMAIMRVRRGGDNNTLNNDIHYSTTSASQFALANKYDDIYIATTITEYFTGAPTEKKTVDISKYVTMMNTYGKSATHSDSYGNTATYADGKLTTPMKTLFGSNNRNHYGKFGYALIGVDAAYNMYKALHGKEITVTQADSSGSPLNGRQTVSVSGDALSIDITDMTSDLAFRATPGSTSATISIKVFAGGKDITSEEGIINASGANYGCVNVKVLKSYDNVTVEVTYTTKDCVTGRVTYTVIDNSIDLPDTLPDSYTWDFDNDLYARDNEGNIVNAINSNALAGTYELRDGILYLTKAQLAIERIIELNGEKCWSIEIKFGDMTNASGFIIGSNKDNVLGNKALSYRGGKLNVSDYADGSLGKGYYNYTPADATIMTGSVMRLVNTYDETTGRSVLSMYRDGILVCESVQQARGDYNGGTGLSSMAEYPLSSDFSFAFIGCQNSSGSFLPTMQIDYIKVDSEIK